MEALLLELVSKYPVVASIFVSIGILRAIFKPLTTLLQKYVKATPSESDNKLLQKVLDSKVYDAIQWFLDYTASIKLPKKEKK